jgi:hypothetical protein
MTTDAPAVTVYHKPACGTSRTERGSTGWKWMSSTGAPSPGNRDS